MPRNNLTYPITTVNKVNRYNNQASYDLSLIHNIVNSSDVLHASFISEDGLPTIIPLIGQMGAFERPSAGIGDPMDVYLHGYVSSRIMNLARNGEKDAGMKICVCATKVDGLVLTLTPNSHNYNYRSAVLHGVATLVTDTAEKLWAMELITNSVCPGRWQNSRVPPDAAEMSSTQIMRMKVESGSAKTREGVPNDYKKDLSRPEVVEKIWTGVVPLYNTLAEPFPGPYNHVPDIPVHVGEYVKERNEREREGSVIRKASLLRQIVAGPRLRDVDAGLDLCYVTDYIIATSGPSSTYPQRAYRNPTDALVQFLDKKHQSNWAIWEFRAEGTGYPDSEVHGRINHYPWPDHHPPPFALIPNIMASMRNWLKDSQFPDRVVVVHCKAGKGRSGTVACSYLISEEAWAVEDALKRFTERRMRQGFGAGVSIPSQLRWVGYVHRWAKHGKLYIERQIEILEVHVWGIRDGVKVAVEGFVDEGKTIKTFHVFSKEERIVIDGTAQSRSVVADLAGLINEKKMPKSSTSSQLDDTPTDRNISANEDGSDPGLKEGSEKEGATSAVIFRPSTRVILPTNDINIGFERRNKAAYGLAMVTAVAHVWFNAFFEGQGAENGGKASDDGVFEIEWDAMDGIKGSSRKGIRALDRIAVVWKAIDAVGEGVPTVITEPPEGTHVPDVRPADWRGANPEHSNLGRDLGLRAETPASAPINKASSTDSAESNGNDNPHRGVQSYGLDGEGNAVDSEDTISTASTQSPEILHGVRDVGLASVAGIVSGMKHVSTGDLPYSKPEEEMKTSHNHIPGHLERIKDVRASS